MIIYVRALYANATSSPTINVNGLGDRAIVKGNNLPLSINDIAGSGFIMHLAFDVNFSRWILLNPATGVIAPETIPVGTLAYMARTGDIAGWLFVDGREHNRSQYRRFIQACPQFIMNGSTSETFKLIDLRGYFLRTLDSGKGVDVGRVFGSIQADEIKAHDHEIWASRWETGGGSGGMGAAAQERLWSRTRVTGGRETRPKNYAFPLYVKV